MLTMWRDVRNFDAQFVAWRDDLNAVCWQSMATTVLATRERTEIDVDDGTFTTIDMHQLMGGGCWKRMQISYDPNDKKKKKSVREVQTVLKK